jgi:hypothetical protein
MPLSLNRLLRFLLVVFFVPAASGAPGASPQNTSPPGAASDAVYPDAASFAAELQRIGQAIEKEKAAPANLAAVRQKLPPQWKISTTEANYSLSAEPLRSLLRDAEKEKDPKKIAAKVAEASYWALDLSNQLKTYADAQTRTATNARPALEQILSRREFGSVHAPSQWDLFRQRVSRWIAEMLSRVFRQLERYPIGAKILLWSILLAVVVWLAVVLFRYWTRRTVLEQLQTPDSVAFVRTWQEWVHAAREAAARGDFREAVHSTYWGGISYLEDNQVVRKDRSRTPREYMRLVSNATQLATSGRKTREALAALTQVLEQVWYGRRPASNQDFASAMQSVEALGCQLQ